jgi:hypothetical protein
MSLLQRDVTVVGPTMTDDFNRLQLAATLEIFDQETGNVISGTKQSTIVGDRVHLGVRANPQLRLQDIEWTVSGNTVAHYSAYHDQPGEVSELSAPYRRSLQITFYWIAGGGQMVEVKARAGDTALVANVHYDVLAPSNVSMTSTTGAVGVGFNKIPDTPWLALYYGTQNQVGIKWTCKATAPKGGAGEFGLIQLVKRLNELIDNRGKPKIISDAQYALDTWVPYNGLSIDVGDGKAEFLVANDNPDVELTADFSKASVNESFRTYFMYRSRGDSIWVTLMRLDWHWAAETTRVGAPGSADNIWDPPRNVSTDTNPTGVQSTELPTWRSIVKGQGRPWPY